MPEAARKLDDVTHTNAMAGLVGGAVAGLALGAMIVAGGAVTVLTGGLAGPVVVGLVATALVVGSTAGAASLGKDAGSLIDSVVGSISTGSPDVHVNSRPAARGYDDEIDCDGLPPFGFPHHGKKFLATGSGTVLINSQPAARIGDVSECDAEISTGSTTVHIGGPTVATREITPEVPAYIDDVLRIAMIGSGIILLPFAPSMILGGAVGGMALGAVGNALGGAIWGEGSKGQAWTELALSVIGSLAGGWGGAKLSGANPYVQWRTNQSIARSRTAFHNAQTLALDPSLRGKTVASDGVTTVSGWRSRDGFTTVPPEEVAAYSNRIGHEPKPAGGMDQGTPGRYNASHAEKQMAIRSPNDPIGVSKAMCADCQAFFKAHAKATRRTQFVTDPNGTHVFYPNGEASFTPRQ